MLKDGLRYCAGHLLAYICTVKQQHAMNTTTTYAVQYTTFVFNGQYMVHGVRQTKWYSSEAEIPNKYAASIGVKYDNENPAERWGGTIIVRTA